MSEPRATLSQINLVVQDMERTLDFYRRLGLTIKDAVEWPPGSGARHTSVLMANGFGLEFDNLAGARIWNPGLDQPQGRGSASVLGFALPSSTAVDELHAELTGVGYRSRLAPHDAFWGARYAIVLDPDLNQVGLMGPIDPKRRFTPTV
ncbi:MAG: glyoxalase [Chloroflexi bacterium]|nr:MAG: glyoxalase [Chloroflexota bacterium]TMD83833.1 MAG: glyoxalase [Chloroflexota bacterium]